MIQEPNTEWELDQEIQDKWRNSLANLTLLSRRKNSQAKNYSFADKKKFIKIGIMSPVLLL